jgi:hypothetical protein
MASVTVFIVIVIVTVLVMIIFIVTIMVLALMLFSVLLVGRFRVERDAIRAAQVTVGNANVAPVTCGGEAESM